MMKINVFKKNDDGVTAIISVILLLGIILSVALPSAIYSMNIVMNSVENMANRISDKFDSIDILIPNTNKSAQQETESIFDIRYNPEDKTATIIFEMENTTGIPYFTEFTFTYINATNSTLPP